MLSFMAVKATGQGSSTKRPFRMIIHTICSCEKIGNRETSFDCKHPSIAYLLFYN